MIRSLIAILLLSSVSGGNGQCSGKEINITSGNGGVSSPNYLNEYGKSANCSWKFTPSAGYALVLTITYQKLYIVKNAEKICLGSYMLTINSDTQECERYIDTTYPLAVIETFEYFDSMCGSDADNGPNVHVQYVSDGRTFTGSKATTTGMGFKIQYKFSKCPTFEETTTEFVPTIVVEETSYKQQASTNPDNDHTRTATKVDSSVATTIETALDDTTAKSAIIADETTKSIAIKARSTREYVTSRLSQHTEIDNTTAGETDGSNSNGKSDTAKLFLVSIPGFIGIIILAVTAIVFCGKRRGEYQDGKNVEQRKKVCGNQIENVESPIQELEQDTAAAAEHDEPSTSTIQNEEAPYTIMYSALARKDEEDIKENAATEKDEQKYDMYSAVVRKTEGGDKETIHM